MSKLVIILCCLQILATQSNARISESSPKTENEESKPLNTLRDHLSRRNNQNVAKNLVIFLGDGTLFSNSQLAFEKFPNTALSKTCSATAYLGGVRGNAGTIGVNGHVAYADCQAMANSSNHVTSIAQWAQSKGKSSGFVTTARVTDASPAGIYGHTSQKEWETDTDVKKSGEDPNLCSDLATQLITGEVGKELNVIMGGGRNAFLPLGVNDEEGGEGYRSDGVNLIDAWKDTKQNQKAQYIWNKRELLNLDYTKTDYVLGLFENLKPSLSEMTQAAIKILSKNSDGYFLFVDGALEEASEFSEAVQGASDLTSEKDTLIVVIGAKSYGEDGTAIFAQGPWSHLFSGVMDENAIPHIMAYAACIGENDISACGKKKKPLIPLPYIF